MLDYCLLESIYLLSNNDKAKYQGWCNAAKSNFEYLASERTVVTRFNALESEGWLEFKDESRFLKRTTLKYFNEVYAYILGVKKLHGEETTRVKELHPKGEETAPIGMKKLHPKGEETAPNNNIDNNKENNNEKESKKDPLPQNEDFNILKDLILKLTLEVESLKAEKEKEKKIAAKKEKEDLVGDTPPVTPPHKTDALQSAWYSADESKDLKPYEVAIFNYQYPATWTDGVKENFKYFCDSAHEKSKGKFGSSNAKGIIIDVNNALQFHKAELVAAALFLCGKNNWSFDINFEINRRAKNQKDAIIRKKQQSDDPTIGTVESAVRARFGENFIQDECTEGYNPLPMPWESEQEF